MENQDRVTHKVPIDMVSPEDLPRETPIKYEDTCRIIGDLYFRLNHNESTQSEQFQAVVGQLQERIQAGVSEISRLKRELAEKESLHGQESEANNPVVTDNVGQGQG